jgi:hypothetical protein
MGKKLDDLKLTDQPIAPLSTPASRDPRETDWYRFSRAIDDLLATGRYTFAEETLRGIQETVEARESVTDGQRQAVANIERSREERPRGGWRRRYEGFR